MTTIRLSKKNFCHIRFVFENSVDAAIYLSGMLSNNLYKFAFYYNLKNF